MTSFIQEWPTPVTFPKYNYQFTFSPADVDLEGDPDDPNKPPTSFKELFKDITIDPQLLQNTETGGWTVIGDGVLDNLMETAYKHLDAQFLSGRIRQENYADMHLQMYLGTLQMFSQSFIQFEIARMQARLQLALENKRMELELQISRERNESTERQSSQDRESQEKQNTERIQAQAALVAAQVKTEIEKKNLHRRQVEAFDEDYKQKIFKILLDSWAVGFSVARDSPALSIPTVIGGGSIESIFTEYIIKDLDDHIYHRAKSTLGNSGME